MPPVALRVGVLALVGLVSAVARPAVHPHMDATLVPGGCQACHQGHGLSRSPMLPAPQREVCLACHSTRAAADTMVARGLLSPTADPPLLPLALSQPFVHPLDDHAFSRREPGAVTCTSCHSPHRQSIRSVPQEAASTGQPKLSTRNPTGYEVGLCAGCHGSAGATTESLLDLSRLTNPNNRSYHPIEAPAAERSPSVMPELRDRQINCTDCHGNSDQGGGKGPHGSAVRHLLRRAYVTIDGSPEGADSYGLCYSCHERRAVLESGPFPLHRLHVVDELVSCASCHSAHGSVENRALIRFGEETFLANVGPSGSTGRLEFISAGPGSGSCFVSCHGVDHAPASYGSASLVPAALLAPTPGLGSSSAPPDASGWSRPRPRHLPRPERPSPVPPD